MAKCEHERTRAGDAYGYTCSVAHEPYTHENRAAHGNITYTETCLDCGAERAVNCNQVHVEFSPWGADRATREESGRIERQAAERKRRQALLAAGRETMRKTRTSVVAVRDSHLLISKGGAHQWIALEEIRKAARQPDDGDGLVPYYTALFHEAQSAGSARTSPSSARRSRWVTVG